MRIKLQSFLFVTFMLLNISCNTNNEKSFDDLLINGTWKKDHYEHYYYYDNGVFNYMTTDVTYVNIEQLTFNTNHSVIYKDPIRINLKYGDWSVNEKKDSLKIVYQKELPPYGTGYTLDKFLVNKINELTDNSLILVSDTTTIIGYSSDGTSTKTKYFSKYYFHH